MGFVTKHRDESILVSASSMNEVRFRKTKGRFDNMYPMIPKAFNVLPIFDIRSKIGARV